MAREYRSFAQVFHEELGWNIFGIGQGPLNAKSESVCREYLDTWKIRDQVKRMQPDPDICTRWLEREQEFDFNLADILAPDRHFGIGWITGGMYHRGELASRDYKWQLNLLLKLFDAMAEYVQRVAPDFVCPGCVGSYFGAVLYIICKKMRIPVFGLNPLNYGSYLYWQAERTGQIPGIQQAYQEAKKSVTANDRVIIEDIAPLTRTFISKTQARGRLSNLFKRLSSNTYHHAIQKLMGYEKMGNIYLSSHMKLLYHHFSHYRKEMKRTYLSEEELGSIQFIYYPLHYEPEATLSGVETYFTNQLYAVEVLTKSVPADVFVLVKEHPTAVGNRPPGWLNTLCGFPRVLYVHPYYNSIALIRRALATVTIAGTAGLEAALLGKPVISMGPCYRFNFVEHVFFANDIQKLRPLISWIAREKKHLDYREEGVALQRSIETTCFRPEGPILMTELSSRDARLAAQHLLDLLGE